MFSFFKKKKNILQTHLLEGMTDIHSHLLPGVDDGAPTLEESLSYFQYIISLGVKRIYLTPHIMIDYIANNKFFLETRFQELKDHITGEIEIKLAAEYMLDAGLSAHLKEGLLMMKDRHVLVETSYLSPPPDLTGMLYELTLEGYIPVIAHPERYRYMSVRDYIQLKEKGYKFQMNLLSLSGYYGLQARENSKYIIRQGMYDYVGSDIHSIDKYQKGLLYLNLNNGQIKELQRLLDNNNTLW